MRFFRQRHGLIVLALLMADARAAQQAASASAPAPTPAPWTVGDPIYTYCNFAIPDGIRTRLSASYGWPAGYDPTTLTADIAEHASTAGFNLVWINDVAQLTIAERYGLRAQLVISGHQPQNNLFFLPYSNWPDPANVPAINAIIDRFKKSPAAYSYFIIDEPDASRFHQLTTIVSYLKERDPAHLAYINLFPPDEITSDLHSKDYATFLADYLRIVQPALLSYDSYNLFDNGDRSLFLGNLQTIAGAAAQAGIPFMTVLQGSRFSSNWRLPSSGELRFLTNAPLAFGAQGISYFNYWSPLGPDAGGLAPHADGTPTSVYAVLRAFSPEFKAVAAQLRDLHWIGTYLKGYIATAIPRYMTPPPYGAAFDVTTISNSTPYRDGAPLKGALMGYFNSSGGAAAAATYVFVENLDYSSSHSLSISGRGPLSLFDADSGTWKATGQSAVDVTLDAGGGVLVALSSALIAP